MVAHYTLSELESSLERLDPAERLWLAASEVERLFGSNDVAMRRIRHFAKGQRCLATQVVGGISFHKLPPN